MRSEYRAREWCRQRSSTTSKCLGCAARSKTNSRSSIFSISRRRRAKPSKSSFSSARMREHRTPILTSLAPVFLFLGRQPELRRVTLDHFQLRAAVAAGYDLALLDVSPDLDVGRRLMAVIGYRSCHLRHLLDRGPAACFDQVDQRPGFHDGDRHRPGCFPLEYLAIDIDAAGTDVDRDRVTVLDGLVDRIALDHRQADVDRGPVEDPRKAAAHDRLDAGRLDRHRGMLARAAAPEVAAADDDVASLDAAGEVRPGLDEAGLAQRDRIGGDVVAARDDRIRRDPVAELEDSGHQFLTPTNSHTLLGRSGTGSSRGSAIAPASAEAAATAGLAR